MGYVNSFIGGAKITLQVIKYGEVVTFATLSGWQNLYDQEDLALL